MTDLNTVLDKITAQQSQYKKGSAPWCVGEQLKDILRAQPEAADLVAQDLEQKGMGIADCEKKIAAFATPTSQGNVGFCGPADADRIIREFYGLPARREESAAPAAAVRKMTCVTKSLPNVSPTRPGLPPSGGRSRTPGKEHNHESCETVP